MAKAPAIQFYVKDWLSDPELKMASHSTKGIWIDALCYMWESAERGLLSGTKEQLIRMLGATEHDFNLFMEEASTFEFANIESSNGNVTIINRRIYQEYKDKQNTRLRVQRCRDKQKGNGDGNKGVTPSSPTPPPTPPTKTYKATSINTIFDFWNEQEIIKHRDLEKYRPNINSALKKYTEEEIITAMKNYVAVYRDEASWWTHKWNIRDFLQRGLDRFCADNFCLSDYIKDGQKKSPWDDSSLL